MLDHVFKIGECVEIMAMPGRRMVVTGLAGEQVHCFWFDDVGRGESRLFPTEILVRWEPPRGAAARRFGQ